MKDIEDAFRALASVILNDPHFSLGPPAFHRDQRILLPLEHPSAVEEERTAG